MLVVVFVVFYILDLSSFTARKSLTYFFCFCSQADKSGSGKIGAAEAATFLKKSNLKEGILHKVYTVKTVGFSSAKTYTVVPSGLYCLY